MIIWLNHNMSIKIEHKLAVVTGSTRGIGQAIAHALREAGADVIETGTKAQYLSPTHYYPVDFSCSKSTRQFADFLSEREPDILINNAGINVVADFEETTPDNFNRIHQVNVMAPFLLCRAVIAGMKKKRWGRIVNISSILGKVSKSGRASYSASKFAMDGMTAALAAEVASFGILANCVAPGFIETDLTRQVLGEQGMADMAQQIPARRLGTPEEIAKFVVWLASMENTYISGQNIAIDGGFTRV